MNPTIDAATDNHPAVGGFVKLRARAGMEDRLIEVLRAAREAAMLESGCLYYDIFRSRDEDRVFFVMDKYRDKVALKQHLATPQAKATQTALGELIEAPPEFALMNEIRNRQ